MGGKTSPLGHRINDLKRFTYKDQPLVRFRKSTGFSNARIFVSRSRGHFRRGASPFELFLLRGSSLGTPRSRKLTRHWRVSSSVSTTMPKYNKPSSGPDSNTSCPSDQGRRRQSRHKRDQIPPRRGLRLLLVIVQRPPPELETSPEDKSGPGDRPPASP